MLHELGWLVGVYPAPAGTPWTYQLWSGFIPALAVLGMAGGFWHKFNCHEPWCLRPHRYHTNLCRKHHQMRLGRDNDQDSP